MRKAMAGDVDVLLSYPLLRVDIEINIDLWGMLKVSQEWNWSCTISPEGTQSRVMGGEGKENKGTTETEVGSCGPEEGQVWLGQHWKSS